jgi:hypothetical protein
VRCLTRESLQQRLLPHSPHLGVTNIAEALVALGGYTHLYGGGTRAGEAPCGGLPAIVDWTILNHGVHGVETEGRLFSVPLPALRIALLVSTHESV